MSEFLDQNDISGPCYVVSSNGFKESVSYEDDWAFDKSAYIGTAGSNLTARDIIKADIRLNRNHWQERNGIPIYTVSDHGNVGRTRAIRLRRL